MEEWLLSRFRKSRLLCSNISGSCPASIWIVGRDGVCLCGRAIRGVALMDIRLTPAVFHYTLP